ncbi:hypothetical protein [Streptomyces sp. H27-D2]|uniref:hypothetical protein n=1 Tax=Streptomyces sp. H27-D2 TaxID=3046304 RepID=UPI002DB59A5B|nr:hypothetical protein [Streptomyces sp. H27-D2]MEC4016555.1 hypothetical protein [Streptomyces sp. H27-D2]
MSETELMPDVNSASSYPSPADFARHGLKVAGVGCAVVIGLPLLILLGLGITLAIEQATSEGYPQVTPAAMARRVGTYSQDAYSAMGAGPTLRPGSSSGYEDDENILNANACYPDGLESMADQPVDGAYSLRHSWSAGGARRGDAVAALRRLSDHFQRTGWDVTEYDQGKDGRFWSVRAERSGEYGDYSAAYSWEPRTKNFSGGVGGPCAMDPGWPEGGDDLPLLEGDGEQPPTLTPGRAAR